MPEPSTLIRKHVMEVLTDHPGWSHSKIARELEDTRPDLVDGLFASRRSYMLNQWVNRIVSDFRIDQRDRLKSGEIIAALSPDGKGRLYNIGEMTGLEVVKLGERYLASGERLTTLGEFYINIGEEAGRRKVKSVFTETRLRDIYNDHTGGT